jgi:hypothetical protein
MSAGERRVLVDRDDPDLPIAAQCRLLNVARSTRIISRRRCTLTTWH